jgi:uncharacterized protein YndB with AHSA1/START domain
MPAIEVTRTINASRSDVWAVLADYPNIMDWNSGIKLSRSTSEAQQGVGATRHCDLKPAGGLEETIREWEPESRLVISIDEATKIPIKSGLATFTLGDANGSTPFTLGYEYKTKGGPLAGLVGTMMKGALKKGFTGFIDDLETAAQSRG